MIFYIYYVKNLQTGFETTWKQIDMFVFKGFRPTQLHVNDDECSHIRQMVLMLWMISER